MAVKDVDELVTKKASSTEKPAPTEKAPFNEETLKAIRDARAGKNLLGRYATTEDMLKDFGS
jgi:hypothetical protein